VLYYPDMGLTLLSISKLADTRFQSLFGMCCKIFNQKGKVIREVPRQSGLYQVDHSLGGQETGGVAKEVLTMTAIWVTLPLKPPST
jgi:hypothetical protein